jgi:hypothetical protein
MNVSPIEYETLLDAWRAWRRVCYARYGNKAIEAFFDLRDGRVKTT